MVQHGPTIFSLAAVSATSRFAGALCPSLCVGTSDGEVAQRAGGLWRWHRLGGSSGLSRDARDMVDVLVVRNQRTLKRTEKKRMLDMLGLVYIGVEFKICWLHFVVFLLETCVISKC